MRIVSLPIAKLGLIVGDVIKLELVDSVGNLMVSSSGYALNASITLDATTFEYSLLESESISQLSNYRLTLPNSLTFNFQVPYSFENANHDLLSLLQVGCFYGIVTKDGDNVILDEKFIKKIELYLTNKNPHFTDTEKSIISLYEYYADEVLITENTIDIIRLMDIYLSKI